VRKGVGSANTTTAPPAREGCKIRNATLVACARVIACAPGATNPPTITIAANDATTITRLQHAPMHGK
jgi:hypothetical protein